MQMSHKIMPIIINYEDCKSNQEAHLVIKKKNME